MGNIVLKKHNSITDGITDFSLPAEKLLNAIYYTWQEKGVDAFTVSIVELKELIGVQSDGNNQFLYDCLEELRKGFRFRNFDYKGRTIKYISSSFLMDITVWKDNQNFADLIINPKIVEALKIKAGYTPIELNVAEKFRTIYGYKLWQMWRRYFFTPNTEHSRIGTIKLTLDELNEKLGTDFKFHSKAKEAVLRGVNEINAIMQKLEIEEELKLTMPEKGDMKNLKEDKHFTFHWSRISPYLQTEPIFIEYMRKNYVNEDIAKDEEKGIISITKDGKLYFKDVQKQPTMDTKTATKTWKYLYNLALKDKLFLLKQQRLDI